MSAKPTALEGLARRLEYVAQQAHSDAAAASAEVRGFSIAREKIDATMRDHPDTFACIIVELDAIGDRLRGTMEAANDRAMKALNEWSAALSAASSATIAALRD